MSLASVSFFAFVWMYQSRPGEGGGGGVGWVGSGIPVYPKKIR